MNKHLLKNLKFFLIALSLYALTFAIAHKPRFPEGDGPFEVIEPSMSQAFYLFMEEGEKHSFVVPPLERLEPIQLLVLDNELGQSLDFKMEWRCNTENGIESDAELKPLRYLDEAFHEPFSGMNHRYRVVDAVGPTEQSCTATIWENTGKSGPYTFAIGEDERFGFLDMGLFFTLGTDLQTWMNGGK